MWESSPYDSSVSLHLCIKSAGVLTPHPSVTLPADIQAGIVGVNYIGPASGETNVKILQNIEPRPSVPQLYDFIMLSL